MVEADDPVQARDFYPRPLRGGRPWKSISWPTARQFLSTPSARRATRHASRCFVHEIISIHALCEEGDLVLPDLQRQGNNFYPRPLRGGRPVEAIKDVFELVISIHALCEEGDCMFLQVRFQSAISIHALCEEGDHGPVSFSPINRLFLSTPSARRATSTA